MGIFDKFKSREKRANPLENPAVSLASPSIFSWLTGGAPTAAGEEVNHFTAMQLNSVFTCINIISENVAKLPLTLYDLNGKGGRVEAFENPLHDILMLEPNPEMTAFSFWQTMTGCLALTGNCYAQIVWNKAGQVDSLWPLHPLKTEPYRLPTGVLAYRTHDGQANGVWRHIDAADIIAVPMFCYDGLKGLSPIMQSRQIIGLSIANEKAAARFLSNDSRPTGAFFLKGQGDEKTASTARDSWERGNAGVNKGRMPFIGSDWSYEQFQLSPEESKYLEMMQYGRTEIAALFRMPPNKLGDTTRLSNSNHEQIQLTFLSETISPYLFRLENELKRKLLPNMGRSSGRYTIAFDVSELLRVDFTTQQKGFQTGVLSGWMSRNEVRRATGENPGPAHLDVFMVPINMQDSERLLDTESMQDQPIGGPVTPPAVAEPSQNDVPTKAERNALRGYRTAYLKLYADAVQRVCKRDADKRDLQAVSVVFTPLLESLSDLSGTEARHIAASDDWQFDPSKAITDHVKTLSVRAKQWKAEDALTIAGAELTRSVRAMNFAAHRAAGENTAEELLKESDETE